MRRQTAQGRFDAAAPPQYHTDTTAALPAGTVTFLFGDIEGSTRLAERHRHAMPAAQARHDALLRAAIAAHGGQVFRPTGDGFCAVFATAPDAVAAALAVQRALHAEDWSAAGLDAPLRVRMALHTGVAEQREGDYFGLPLNRVARLRDAGHGGQILLSLATEQLVRDVLPERASLRDLGEHVLRGLARPERVFQVLHPNLPADQPPLRTLDALPNNLPIQLTSFVGRARELDAIGRLLTTQRLVTLTGTGGTGKTRLALHLAADVLPTFPDGVWLVELAPLADPARLAPAVAAAAGVREDPTRPPLAALVDALRSKRVLLVLDNCEHLIEACAGLANALVRACPQLRLLATSREALGIDGETARRVVSLPHPQPDTVLAVEELARYDAVRLFAERAAAVQPSFAITDANATVLAQVCHRLDGIPLAIELAAARLRHLSLDQLLARLEDRFRLLTGGSRTALERHQTLQAAVDWSYDLLTPAEQTVFSRLSVFVHGWTLEAAEAVCADATADGGRRHRRRLAIGGPPSSSAARSSISSAAWWTNRWSPRRTRPRGRCATGCWRRCASTGGSACLPARRPRRCTSATSPTTSPSPTKWVARTSRSPRPGST